MDGESAVVGKGLNAPFHELSSALAFVVSVMKRALAKQILLALVARADNELRLMIVSPQNNCPNPNNNHLWTEIEVLKPQKPRIVVQKRRLKW